MRMVARPLIASSKNQMFRKVKMSYGVALGYHVMEI
jgi:hypothetical protein